MVLDRPPKHEPSVIDVYLGKEQKLAKLPPKLARGLRRLLLNTPTIKTTSTSGNHVSNSGAEVRLSWNSAMDSNILT